MSRPGLDGATITKAAARIVDEVGIAQFRMSKLAELLGVKTPSLYKHVANEADLLHRIAILATNEYADCLGEAIQGLAGRDALFAGARAMRTFAKNYPGRYAVANAARQIRTDDQLVAAADRVIGSWAAMLQGYSVDNGQKVHASRMLRSLLHGCASLEAVGGFQLDTNIEKSFDWMIDFIDRGLSHPVADRIAQLDHRDN